MSIAIATLSRLLSPLWLSPVTSLPQRQADLPRKPMAVRRPTALRVTRLAEDRLPRHLAGRMVISGRFEDVCRELARLEALGEDRTH
jgi:hypothetical protein